VAFKYTNRDGNLAIARDVAGLEAALKTGVIDPDTPVFDDKVNVTLKAAALIAVNRRKGPEPSPLSAAPAVRTKKAPANREPGSKGLMIAGTVGGLAAALAIAFVSARFGQVQETAKETRESEQAALRVLADATRKSLEEGKAPAPARPPAPAAPVPVDERSMLGRIVPVYQFYQGEFQRLQKEFEAFETTVDMNAVVAPAVLATETGRERNRETIRRYTEALVRHRKNEIEVGERFKAEVEKVVGASPDSAVFLENFNDARARRDAIDAESNANLLSLMKRMQALNDYVAARSGSLQLQGGKLIFATQADLDGYQAIAADLGRISAAEEALDQRRQAIMREGLAKIESQLEKK
jgi:hypothetical protein